MSRSEERVFRCAVCGNEFHVDATDSDVKCPKCRSRTLILLEGESVGKKAGCAPSG
jgi:DNA-directed RNA polymerase subunit RPC12/RpoP